MDDAHPLEFSKTTQIRDRGDLFIFPGAVYEAHILCFYWADEVGVFRASTNGLKVVYVPLILKVRQERDLKKWHQDGF